jgi:hypothetical protein
MRSTRNQDVQNGRVANQRRVLLVSVAPIPRRSLESMLSMLAEVRIVDHGSTEYDEAATHFHPQLVIVDLTHLGNLRTAQDIAGRFDGEAQIVFLGYAHDEGEEASISQEMGALFNPSLGELMVLVAGLRPQEAHDDSSDGASVHCHTRSELPTDRGAIDGVHLGD